jgi:hypothetical protein
MSEASLLYVTIDATDAPRAAAFWSALLGTAVDSEIDEGRSIFLRAKEGLAVLCIQLALVSD